MPYESSGDVYVLADKYGRVLVQHVVDGDYYQAVVWSDTRFDWDSLADPDLLPLMNDRGYVEALTIEENLDVTVNIGGESETYVWDAAKAEFDHDFDLWANGERTLALKWFQRENGDRFCAVVEANSGGPITWSDQSGQSRCLVILNPGDETPEFELALLSQYPELEQDVAGLVEIKCYESPVPGYIGVNTFIDETDENIYVINISDDGAYTESSSRLPPVAMSPGLFARLTTDGPPSYLVNFSGKALRFRTNTGYHTYIVDVLADHYAEEPTIPQGWEYVDVNFNGDEIKNGSFVYDDLKWVCENSVLKPKIDQVYEG